GQLAAPLDRIADHDVPGAEGSGPVRGSQSDGAGAEHGDVFAGLERAAAEPPAGHGEGLDERLFGAGEPGGEGEQLVRPQHGALGEAPGTLEADQLEGSTVVGATTRAPAACTAAGQRPSCHSAAGSPALDA